MPLARNLQAKRLAERCGQNDGTQITHSFGFIVLPPSFCHRPETFKRRDWQNDVGRMMERKSLIRLASSSCLHCSATVPKSSSEEIGRTMWAE